LLVAVVVVVLLLRFVKAVAVVLVDTKLQQV
jgi:hypothetical protein